MAKIYILIAFLPHLLCAMVQKQPSSCSEYFTYMTKSGITDMLGQIEIPPPSINDTFYLKVALNTTTELMSQVVRLELARSIQESIRHVYEGRPLLYHIYHPMHEPIPSLSAIWFNNQRYCPGPEANGNITATIELGHILYPLNEQPLVYSYGPWPQISQPWHRNSSTYHINKPSYDHLNLKDSTPITITPSIEISNDECGITSYYTDDTNRLISNKETVLPGQWPWLVAIYKVNLKKNSFYSDSFWGTGSILTTRHIITAGQMWELSNKYFLSNIYVSFGQFNSQEWYNQNIKRLVVGYDISSYTRDACVVIMMLDKAIEYNAFIKPICLWSGSTNFQDIVNMTGYVVGWGAEHVHNPFQGPPHMFYTQEPRVAKMPLMNLTEHAVDEDHKVFIFQSQNVSYPCDTGGGLVVFNTITGRYQLRGIASQCAPPWDDTRYIDLASQISWIRNQISVT